ncbi:MAG: single-stranded-DNA-specific exonuclease RecJ [Proteobacteria bacterium]|nr:single-stranded-DNA-specific exonuclease RecJ [Pseudomonadota bacterium]
MTGRPEPVFLGVERSFTGKRWHERLVDARLGLTLAQRLSVPEIIGRALAARGVGVDDAESYLNPTLREYFPDPRHLIDMDVAVERLVRAVRGGEKIAVFGDYDVDGATSAALIKRFFAAVGAEVAVYIPDRLKEGYGPNEAALIKLRRQGIDIVITVDCGISAHGPLAAAAEAGLDVIVVDHHVAEATLPRALAVINPNRLDEHSPHGALAAVGVAYLLCVAVNAGLREAGWYGDGAARRRAEPDLIRWLDLVALGTVCDMVPLTGLNRALASQGLKVLAKRRNTGLAALADVVGLDARPEAWHLGFVLGPRINAGGRVGDADLGVRLLTTNDESEARALAMRLDGQNTERKAIEAAVLEQALAQAEGERGAGVVFVSAQGWHPGVIGIVASTLARRFGRPALVVALLNGVCKGSGRSVKGVDLGSSVIAARQEGLLINGGGHPMAAGFTVARDKLGALREFIEARVAAEIEAGDIGPTLMLDGALKPEATTVGLVDLIGRLGPFGSGNAEPRFAFPSVRVAKADVVGENHVRCFLTASEGGGRLKAIAFRSAGTALGDALLDRSGLALHIAGHVRRDDWKGRDGVQLLIDDAAPAHGQAT